MLTCDHFIYTSAKTNVKEGYQIVAKSEGVTEEIISELTRYYYPIGIDPEKFTESRSMLILKKNLISYSIVKNIGIGYDARKGTLYNHTFIIDKDDFAKLGSDTRIFDKYFIFNNNLKGSLERIRIEKQTNDIDFTPFRDINPVTIQNLFWFLFLKRKVAMTIINHYNLIQNILSILPPSLRLIPFSTLVNEPEKQSDYDLIQIDESVVYKLGRSWKIIESPENSMQKLNSDKEDFQYLTQLIQREDKKAILKLQQSFEIQQGNATLEKMRFLLFDILSNQTLDIQKKAQYSLECANAAQKIDPELMSKYLDRAEKYSKEIKSNELLAQIETGRFAESLNKSSLNVSLLEKILNNFRDTDSDVRVMFLKKIFKKKKDEIQKKGLLGEIILSGSFYQDEFLRTFVEMRELHPQIVGYFESSNLARSQQLKLFETFVKLSLSYNFPLVVKLFENTKINWDTISELGFLKSLVKDIFSETHLKENQNIPAYITLAGTIKNRLKINLNQLSEKDSDNNLVWKSDQNFENFRDFVQDIITILSTGLRSFMDYGNEKLSENWKMNIIRELKALEQLSELLHSIKYSKKKESRSPKFDPYATWFWWLR